VTAAADFVVVGKLGKTRGIAGEMYITLATDFPERFLELETIHVRQRGVWQEWQIASIRLVGGRPVIRLEGIETPEGAARLTNLELGVPRDQVVELPEGSYYIFDLVGCRVYNDADDRLLGEVENVELYPANDVYVVKTPSGKQVLFPAVVGYVKVVDIAQKVIRVDSAGLFDEGEAGVGQTDED